MERHAIITGGAGFIGSHLVDRLLGQPGWHVSVVDNFHPFYPREVKEANVARHRSNPAFDLIEGDILDDDVLKQAFEQTKGRQTMVVHLAALAGVRPSLADPIGYHRVNVTGTLKLLEAARHYRAAHFVQGSSSSVYGDHPAVPWKEDLTGLKPISPYAATKLAAESFVQVYARLHGMDCTVLRLFTAYGPRQRPDLAIHGFFRKMIDGKPIQQFGDGGTQRDYTYVGDVVDGICRAMDRPMARKPGQGAYEVFNLGNSEAVPLRVLIASIEEVSGRKAIIKKLPEQPGDVHRTLADIAKAREQLGYAPQTTLAEGLGQFARWFATVGPVGKAVG